MFIALNLLSVSGHRGVWNPAAGRGGREGKEQSWPLIENVICKAVNSVVHYFSKPFNRLHKMKLFFTLQCFEEVGTLFESISRGKM